MSTAGDLNRLSKRQLKDHFDIQGKQPTGGSRLNARYRPNGKIINGLNDAGDEVAAFSCVRILDPDEDTGLPLFAYPSHEDDEEESMYGSLLETTGSGESGFIQLSGNAIFILNNGNPKVKFGEKMYPLTNGKVGNKDGNSMSIIGSGIGRALTQELADTNLVEVSLIPSGGGESSLINCKVATTANHALSGLSNVDGIAIEDGDLILVWKQTSGGDNGVYVASADAWERLHTFSIIDLKVVSVAYGTAWGKLMFVIKGGAAEPMGAVWGV